MAAIKLPDGLKVKQVLPADGWRAAICWGKGKYYVLPLTAWALSENESGEQELIGLSVLEYDFDQTVWTDKDKYFICYLEPGEEKDDDELIRMNKIHWEVLEEQELEEQELENHSG